MDDNESIVVFETNSLIANLSKDRAPDLCHDILKKHEILHFFESDLIEIYPCRSKKIQFEKFWKQGWHPKKTIFFDDSFSNVKELQNIGVQAKMIEKRTGVTLESVKTALDYVENR